jgi:hypothetical protein
MKNIFVKSMISGCPFVLAFACAVAFQDSLYGDSELDQEFDLSGEHSQETQYFLMESKLFTYALDGKRLSTDVFRLRLKCVPARIAG